MRRPWRRRVPGRRTPYALRAEWRLLPPMDATLTSHPTTVSAAFTESLATWRDFAFLARLGHVVTAVAPAGVVHLRVMPDAVVGRPAPAPPAPSAVRPTPDPRPEPVEARELTLCEPVLEPGPLEVRATRPVRRPGPGAAAAGMAAGMAAGISASIAAGLAARRDRAARRPRPGMPAIGDSAPSGEVRPTCAAPEPSPEPKEPVAPVAAVPGAMPAAAPGAFPVRVAALVGARGPTPPAHGGRGPGPVPSPSPRRAPRPEGRPTTPRPACDSPTPTWGFDGSAGPLQAAEQVSGFPPERPPAHVHLRPAHVRLRPDPLRPEPLRPDPGPLRCATGAPPDTGAAGGTPRSDTPEPPCPTVAPAGTDRAPEDRLPTGDASRARAEPTAALLDRLYAPLLRRLRAELRLERERRGELTDLRY
ncbi:hypothetical protein ACGF0J_06160 [Nonomuraea sp. NPDC047897]|uniref:hypothetical protein n=1 Tax=Nonomuraea sp. NPDC047897 TaxID=3364346 RepID=UPI00371CC57E